MVVASVLGMVAVTRYPSLPLVQRLFPNANCAWHRRGQTQHRSTYKISTHLAKLPGFSTTPTNNQLPLCFLTKTSVPLIAFPTSSKTYNATLHTQIEVTSFIMPPWPCEISKADHNRPSPCLQRRPRLRVLAMGFLVPTPAVWVSYHQMTPQTDPGAFVSDPAEAAERIRLFNESQARLDAIRARERGNAARSAIYPGDDDSDSQSPMPEPDDPKDRDYQVGRPSGKCPNDTRPKRASTVSFSHESPVLHSSSFRLALSSIPPLQPLSSVHTVQESCRPRSAASGPLGFTTSKV